MAPMELGPIPGINRVRPVNAPEKGRGLAPALLPDRSGRMDDKEYSGHGDEPEDGLAEDSEAAQQDQTEKKIDLIA